MHRVILVLLFVTMPAVSGSLAAAPYDLDSSFGEGGGAWIAEQQPASSIDFRHMLMLPDGSTLLVTLVGLLAEIARFLPTGERDPGFGETSGLLFSGCPLPTSCTVTTGKPARQPDGKIVIPLILGRSPDMLSPMRYGVVRLLADGRRDSAFGTNGVAALDEGVLDDVDLAGIAIDSSGRMTVVGESIVRGAGPENWSFARFQPNGTPDATFGPGARRVVQVSDVPASLSAFASSPDGGFAIVGYESQSERRTIVAKFLPTGELDSQFGVFKEKSLGGVVPTSVAIQSNGAVVIGGFTSPELLDLRDQFAVLRLQANGARDLTFGRNGQIRLAMVPTWRSFAWAVALDSKQRIVLAGSAGGADSFQYLTRVAVARLLPDGQPDTLFASGGKATIWQEFGTGPIFLPSFLAIAPDDRIVLNVAVQTGAGIYGRLGYLELPRRAALFRLVGGNGTVPIEQEQRMVIEYFHAGFGHYFVTPLHEETFALDAGREWVRTGRGFRAWMDGGTELQPTCRFFSDQSFAPKSSHFYTPYPDECTHLRANSTVWKYEGSTFHLRLPEGSLGSRTCAAGTEPLHRVYNNGQGGAPNHRYTTDPALLDEMIARGWTMEGEASTRVFACVPVE